MASHINDILSTMYTQSSIEEIRTYTLKLLDTLEDVSGSDDQHLKFSLIDTLIEQEHIVNNRGIHITSNYYYAYIIAYYILMHIPFNVRYNCFVNSLSHSNGIWLYWDDRINNAIYRFDIMPSNNDNNVLEIAYLHYAYVRLPEISDISRTWTITNGEHIPDIAIDISLTLEHDMSDSKFDYSY